MIMKKYKILFVLLAIFSLAFFSWGCKKEEPPVMEYFEVNSIPVPSEHVIQKNIDEEAIETEPAFYYVYHDCHEVDGRQGIAWSRGYYFVSGNRTLSCYDWDWNLLYKSDNPLENINLNVNHISDIDVYQGELFAGIENFKSGYAKNLLIAVYDANTFELKRTYNIEPKSGMREISGITVDQDTGSIWLSSWVNERTGEFVYRYDLEDGRYLGRVHLDKPVKYIQGISYFDGSLYFSSDDGDASMNEPDHLYRCKVDLTRTEFHTVEERTFYDVILQGEIEGMDFDHKNKRLLISYNRGLNVKDGKSSGFIEGYDREYHEIFTYDLH